MCSAEEILERTVKEKGSLSNFEQSKYINSADLCIKRYPRPAADRVMNEKSEIRPPLIINHVMKYMRDCIVD